MRQLWTVPLLSLAYVSFLTVSGQSANAALLFKSNLTGAQEVAGSPPGPFTPAPTGSPAVGSATLELTGSAGSWVLTYEVKYRGLEGEIAEPYAHIHNAPFGVNGPIVHHLDNADIPPIAGSTSGTIVGDWRFDDVEDPLTDALAGELLESNLYLNIHTTVFPSGEIRGQILPVPEPSTSLTGFILSGAAVELLRRKLKS